MASEMQSILDAIDKNHTEVKQNHAEVVELIDGLALSTQAGFNRVEAELATVKTDVRELQSSVVRIETKLDRHESRIEGLESRP